MLKSLLCCCACGAVLLAAGQKAAAETPDLLLKLKDAARGSVYNICLIENGVSYTAEITPAE